MRKFCFYITLFLSAALFSQSYLSSSLPSPKDSGAENYVCNPDGILSDTCCIALNRLSETLDRRVEVELAVCAINAISGDDAYSFALNLFNTWGIGKSGKNTGVLILLVMHSRDIQIITGGGIEGLLPDAQCKRIIENDMVPLLSAGKYDEGMLRGAEAIAQRLLTDEAQAELLLDVKRKDTTGTDILTLYLGAALLMLIQGLAGCVLFVMLFSQHPTTSTNLQILLLNPLPLFFIPAILKRKKSTLWWPILGTMAILFFIGAIWQHYAEGMIVLALCLLIRIWSNKKNA